MQATALRNMRQPRFLKVSTDLQKRVSIALLKVRTDGHPLFTVQSEAVRPMLLQKHSGYYRALTTFRTYPEALQQLHKLTKEASLTLGTMVTSKVPLHLSVPQGHLSAAS